MSISVSRAAAFAVVLGSFVLTTVPVHAQPGQWYIGAGAGISRLTPETEGSGFTLDDDNSLAASLFMGVDVNNWLGIEAAYTDLGEAGLSGDETIAYSAMSLGGIAYVFGDRDARRRQDAWSGFVRFGLNKINNESNMQLDKKDNTALWLGAGIQWPVGPTWGVRGELTSFDGDSQAAMASLYWRPTAQQNFSAGISRVPPASTQINGPSVSNCAVLAAAEPLKSQGCALFSGVLQGVEFESDTTTLTPVGETLLSRLADSLNLYPELIVEIRVHTQTYTVPDRARSLSRERALAVARILVAQGVDVKRLKARAYGSIQPRAGNDTTGGRRLNNRVELRAL